MRSVSRVLALLSLVAVAAVARADYMLEPTTERYVVVADDWKIDGSLTVTRGDKKTTYKIELMWLADRIDGNLICTGEYKKAMTKYLAGLESQKNAKLKVELVTTRKDGELFVAGLWKLEAAEEKTLREKSDAEWKKIDARPVAGKKPVEPAR
jgi:hypothetical protein